MSRRFFFSLCVWFVFIALLEGQLSELDEIRKVVRNMKTFLILALAMAASAAGQEYLSQVPISFPSCWLGKSKDQTEHVSAIVYYDHVVARHGDPGPRATAFCAQHWDMLASRHAEIHGSCDRKRRRLAGWRSLLRHRAARNAGQAELK
jgi:hypothetical protein